MAFTGTTGVGTRSYGMDGGGLRISIDIKDRIFGGESRRLGAAEETPLSDTCGAGLWRVVLVVVEGNEPVAHEKYIVEVGLAFGLGFGDRVRARITCYPGSLIPRCA